MKNTKVKLLALLSVCVCVHLWFNSVHAQDNGTLVIKPVTNTVTRIAPIQLTREQTAALITAITTSPDIANIVRFDPAALGKFKVLVFQSNANGTSTVSFR